MKLENSHGENLDLLIEGNEKSTSTIVFVHGFGTQKNENDNLFPDISDALKKDFRIVRFDFSGYGQSDGVQEETDYNKQVDDLKAVLAYARKTFPGTIHIIAHSMAAFITTIVSPQDIQKTIFTSPPSPDISSIAKRLQERILRNGGTIDEKGITIYARTNGDIQRIGPSFWQVLKSLNPVKIMKEYSKKTDLILYKPLEDEITGQEYFDDYKRISTLQYKELHGDHNFTTPKERKILIQEIVMFLSS